MPVKIQRADAFAVWALGVFDVAAKPIELIGGFIKPQDLERQSSRPDKKGRVTLPNSWRTKKTIF